MIASAVRQHPTAKRAIALTLIYVLTLQALFGAGAQIRVLLAETPGLCTLLGFEKPEQPKHALDACAVHCVGHAGTDTAGSLAAVLVLIALTGWLLAAAKGQAQSRRVLRAYDGRAPPR